MATLKLILDQRRQRIDGTFPLVIRVTHQSKSRNIPLNIHLSKADWDEETLAVKKSRSNSKILNHCIKTKYVELEAELMKMETDKKVFSIQQAKNQITGAKKVLSFFEFGEMWVQRLENSRKLGNARTYNNVLKW